MASIVLYQRLNNHNYCSDFDEHKKLIYGKSNLKYYRLKLQHDKRVANLSKDKSKQERTSSGLSMTNRRTKDAVICTVKTIDEYSTNQVQPKSILKSKQSSAITPKCTRVISAPVNGQRNSRKKSNDPSIPSIIINSDDDDESLGKSRGYSYTQVCSSSQHSNENIDQSTRQTVLNTIMSHLLICPPNDLSKWNLYREFNEKISTSFSPHVYRNFERIIL